MSVSDYIRRRRRKRRAARALLARLEQADRDLESGNTRPLSEVIHEMAVEAITDEIVDELWMAKRRGDIRRTLYRLLTENR